MSKQLWGAVSVIALALAIAGCSPPAVDSSSEEAAKASVEKIRESLPEADKERFDKALFAVMMNSAMGDKSLLEMASADPEQMKVQALARLDGKSAEDIFQMADQIRLDRLQAEKMQALAEIAELEKKQQDALAAAAGLSKFEVTRSRYYKQPQRYGRPEPVIELAVSNNTGSPISRAHFKGVVTSPGRSVPWIEEEFNYEIAGGIETGESVEWSLAPNMFSDWGRDTPADAVLTVTVTRVDGADGEPLYDASAFTADMASRLASLKESYAAE